MSHTIETVENENGKIEIWVDETAESPRKWDNLGTFYTWMNRYESPDEHSYPTARDFLESYAIELRTQVHAGNVDNMSFDRLLKLTSTQAIILPVYMYEHSGRAFSTSPFSCQWDSGQVGFIFVSKKDIREAYGVKKITKSVVDTVVEVLNGEVKEYEKWAEGRVWGYTIEDKDGNDIDSCGGFYYDSYAEAIKDNLQPFIDSNTWVRELVKELN